jgi:hypothetical protein
MSDVVTGGASSQPPIIKKNEKLAIVGFAPTWNQTPFKDEKLDIWACNEFYLVGPRIDVLFELHSRHEIENKVRNKEHLTWLQAATIPVFMTQHFDDIPNSIPFPKDEIVAKFGSYFTNTISWQIALAIALGYKEIYLYGINMANDDEYTSQRPSVEYFVGLARGLGIKVILPDECDICKSWYLYGFENEHSSVVAKRLAHFLEENRGRQNQARAAAEQNIATMHQAIGMVNATDYIMKAFLYKNTNFNEEKQKPKET